MSGAVGSNPGDLGGRGDRRHEDPRGPPGAHGRVRDRCAVIATRSRHDAGRRHLAEQQVSEGAACFEGAGVLQVLQLADQRERLQPEVRAADLNRGRDADVRLDYRIGALDLAGRDAAGHGC